MRRYILRRIVMLVPVLFGVSLVSFSLLHLVPGDPAEVLGGQEATKEDVDRIRREYGLDRPLVVPLDTAFLVLAAVGSMALVSFLVSLRIRFMPLARVLRIRGG